VEAGLADSRITDKSLERISSYQNVRRVNLSGTAVTGAGASKALALPHLEVLILTGTVVDDAWLQGIHPGTSLKTLGLFQTKVTQQAAEAFQKAHPKLNLYGPIKVVPPVSPPPSPQSSPAKDQQTPLEKQMQILSDGMKQLSDQINEPAKQTEMLTLIGSLKKAAMDAKTMEPVKTASVAPADKEKFLAEYRAQLDKLATAFASIEAAVKGAHYDQAKALLATIGDLRKKSHATFKVAAPVNTPSPSPTAPTALNTLCPYSKKPVVESTLLEINGRKVAFCCEDCRQKFLSHPEAQAEILKSPTP
jgi:soluble cytochrome b562